MLGPGKLDISKWVPKSTMLGPKIDDVRCTFLIYFLLILCLILLLGQADQIREEHTQRHRAHTEHTQRQPNRKEPKWLCEVYGNSQNNFEDSHKDEHEDPIT